MDRTLASLFARTSADMRFRKDIKRNKHKLKDLIRATEEEKVEEF